MTTLPDPQYVHCSKIDIIPNRSAIRRTIDRYEQAIDVGVFSGGIEFRMMNGE